MNVIFHPILYLWLSIENLVQFVYKNILDLILLSCLPTMELDSLDNIFAIACILYFW